MKFVWKYLPVFFMWAISLSVLNNALHHIAPPVESVRLLSLCPLAGFLILLWHACRKEYGEGHFARQFVAWSLPMTVIYLTPFLYGSSMPLDLETQRVIYEFSALLQFVILLIHGRTWLKSWDWAWIFGVTLCFGLILENGGITLGVFSEPGYLLYLPLLPAPLATALGWANVLYCAFFICERVLPEMTPFRRGLVCALVGLALDIPFDPVATRLEWWVWAPSLEAKVWGVPVINFIAWFWALFPYCSVYYLVRGIKGYSEGRKIGLLLAGFPLILAGELAGVILSLALAGDREGIILIQRFFTSLGLI